MTDYTNRPVTWPADVYSAKVKDITAYTERMLTSDAPSYQELEQQLAEAVATLKETQAALNARNAEVVELSAKLAASERR